MLGLKVIQLRVLRYARSREPLTLTPGRMKVVREMIQLGLVEVVLEVRAILVVGLTHAGALELGILEAQIGASIPDYATKTKIRRVEEGS